MARCVEDMAASSSMEKCDTSGTPLEVGYNE